MRGNNLTGVYRLAGRNLLLHGDAIRLDRHAIEKDFLHTIDDDAITRLEAVPDHQQFIH